jgi:hypothetical protein
VGFTVFVFSYGRIAQLWAEPFYKRRFPGLPITGQKHQLLLAWVRKYALQKPIFMYIFAHGRKIYSLFYDVSS